MTPRATPAVEGGGAALSGRASQDNNKCRRRRASPTHCTSVSLDTPWERHAIAGARPGRSVRQIVVALCSGDEEAAAPSQKFGV